MCVLQLVAVYFIYLYFACDCFCHVLACFSQLQFMCAYFQSIFYIVPSHANCATRLCVFMVGLSDLTTGMYLVFCLLVEFMVKCSYKLIHVLAALLLS